MLISIKSLTTVFTTAFVLTGCATYHPVSLPEQTDLLQDPSNLTVYRSELRLPAIAPHEFDPSNGFDSTEIATLAVLNNPDLKAMRTQIGVAHAQLFNAGLLPDPQLAVSLDDPTSGPPPLTTAYGLNIAQDLQALVTRGAAQDSKAAALQQIRLNILWQEWQVAQQARMLYVRLQADDQLFDLLTKADNLLHARYTRASRALVEGNITLDTAAADLVALLDADTMLRALQQQTNQTRHELNALLGLAPEAELILSDAARLPDISRSKLDAGLANLPQRRPDLIALQAGYESQEQLVREAVLAQFPALNVGFTKARDTGDVHTIGFGVTLTLPLFNRNRGNIAIERATREQLGGEYQARLDQSVSDIHLMWMQTQLLSRQLASLQAQLPELQGMTDKAQAGYDSGNLDPLIYFTLESSLLAKYSEAIRLEQSLNEAQIGLTTLLGMPLESQDLKNDVEPNNE